MLNVNPTKSHPRSCPHRCRRLLAYFWLLFNRFRLIKISTTLFQATGNRNCSCENNTLAVNTVVIVAYIRGFIYSFQFWLNSRFALTIAILFHLFLATHQRPRIVGFRATASWFGFGWWLCFSKREFEGYLWRRSRWQRDNVEDTRRNMHRASVVQPCPASNIKLEFYR